jgi:DNA-binding NtrC family response regulator
MSWVLLVENSDAHTELADSLRADGHQVTEVTGREHLTALLEVLHEREHPVKLPDVIIGDAEQSGGPGLDLLLEAQGLGAGTPVILLSDAPDVDLLREAEALRAAYVFFSPAEVNALRQATKRLG